jgi:hypothetical protein
MQDIKMTAFMPLHANGKIFFGYLIKIMLTTATNFQIGFPSLRMQFKSFGSLQIQKSHSAGRRLSP